MLDPMDMEAITVGLVVALATLPLLLGKRRQGRPPAALSLWGLWLGVSALMAWAASGYAPASRAPGPALDRPIETLVDGYVSSDSCQACHPREYDTWHSSYHRTMTQVATPQTVRAPWPDGSLLQAQERTYRLQRRGDGFFVEMDDPDWEGRGTAPRVWKQVVLITGSHHFQFYHVATGSSRKLSIFPFCYRIVDGERWMPLDGCCIGPPMGRQESGTGRWNRVCIKCHTTHGRPGVSDWDTMDSHVVEFGIACEACHGPADEHTRLNRNPKRRYELHLSGEPDSSIVNPAHLSPSRASQVCGQCHGITAFRSAEDRQDWMKNGFPFRPGDELTDTREFSVSGADKYWSDGMVRVSGREFMGLRETPCFQRGELSCLSCHTMHKPADDPRPMFEWANDQLKLGMETNEACLPCHEEYREEPALAKHTRHGGDSTGSLCYNCHMPYTTYGLLKAIRSHQVDSPSVAASLQTGRPNACNQCHLDKTLAWAADRLHEWYDIPVPDMTDDEQRIAASVLWTLKGDAGQRALMAWSMGWDAAREVSGADWMTPYLSLLMTDPYIAVRYIAQRSFQMQPEAKDISYDFVDPAESRQMSTYRAVEAWKGRAGEKRTAGESLLMSALGAIDQAEFGRLLRERDHRPVTLNE